MQTVRLPETVGKIVGCIFWSERHTIINEYESSVFCFGLGRSWTTSRSHKSHHDLVTKAPSSVICKREIYLLQRTDPSSVQRHLSQRLFDKPYREYVRLRAKILVSMSWMKVKSTHSWSISRSGQRCAVSVTFLCTDRTSNPGHSPSTKIYWLRHPGLLIQWSSLSSRSHPPGTEPERPLLPSEDDATGPKREPDQSSQHPHTLIHWSIIMLPNLHLNLETGLFSSGFDKNTACIYNFTNAYNIHSSFI